MHIRVLFINVVCGIRSTGRICTDLAEQYIQNGYECRIAYGRECVPEKYQSIAVRIGNERDVRINAIKARLLDNEGLNAVRQTQEFLRWADEYDPDELWLHNLHGYYINYELLFAWIKRRPGMKVKWTLHDCWSFTGHCSHFMVAGCNQWRTQCLHCPEKKRYPASVLLDNCRANYRRKKAAFTGVKELTLITPSQWLADLVKQSFLSEYPVEVHYNTIDTEVFRPTPGDFRKRHALENKYMILGVASAWNDRKGLTDFYKLRELLDDSYAIVLVGLTEKQITQLPRGILGIARTNSKQELAEIYTAADVFVNPTYEDTYPTVNLEAEACGTRVVTYDTGGCRETLQAKASRVVEVGVVEYLGREIIAMHSGD